MKGGMGGMGGMGGFGVPPPPPPPPPDPEAMEEIEENDDAVRESPHNWMDMFEALGDVEAAIGEFEGAREAGDLVRQGQGGACCSKFCECFKCIFRLLTLRCLYDCYDEEAGEVKPCLPCLPDRLRLQSGSYPDKIIKSIAGFTIGIFISFLCYVVMIYQLLYSPKASLYFCVPLGTFLSMGLAYSTNIRCITMLFFPSLCSKQGRAAILAFIFVLVIAHPMMNFRANVHALSASSTCGQEVGYNASKEIVDMAMKPVDSMKTNMRGMINDLVEVGEKIRNAFMKVRNLYSEICTALKRTFQWLGNMINVCNERMGAPYRKCMSSFNKAHQRCRKKLSILKVLCEVVKGFQWLCSVARIGELLCRITEAITNYVKSKLIDKLKFALQDVTDMFFFKVTMIYHFNYTMEQSKTYKEVGQDIQREVDEKLGFLSKISGCANFIFLILLIFTIIKSMIYRYKYRRSDKFDNMYISYEVRRINYIKQDKGKEEILPLKWKEKWLYVYTESPLLTKKEIRSLFLGMIMLALTAVHIGFYLGLDYGLYWLLNMLRGFMAGEPIGYDTPSQVKIRVQGEGMFSDMYRVLISKMNPAGAAQKKEEASLAKCLPSVSPPDLHIYKVIGYLFLGCLILTIFEAYLLRLRHVVCATYFPAREKERAAWLSHQILVKRGGFAKHFKRLKLQAFDPYRMPQEKPDWKSHLAAKHKWIGKLFKFFGFKRKFCISCALPGKVHDKDNFVHCDNSGCKAVYCSECYEDANNLCTLCMKPIIYEDLGNRSEEIDSSDDSPDDAADRKKFYEKRFQKFMVDYAIGRHRRKRFEASGSDSDSDGDEIAPFMPIMGVNVMHPIAAPMTMITHPATMVSEESDSDDSLSSEVDTYIAGTNTIYPIRNTTIHPPTYRQVVNSDSDSSDAESSESSDTGNNSTTEKRLGADTISLAGEVSSDNDSETADDEVADFSAFPRMHPINEEMNEPTNVFIDNSSTLPQPDGPQIVTIKTSDSDVTQDDNSSVYSSDENDTSSSGKK